MDIKQLWKVLIKTSVSLLFGGIFYFFWMAAAITTFKSDTHWLLIILWPLAPVVTALGFAIGVVIFERLTDTSKTKFLHIYIWPLVGCAGGVGVVYWFGPMLIVFAMLAFGTVSVALREFIQYRRENQTRE
ncbi:MAG: hypothetical protein JSV03_07015 [Planctomycetota bacterium]|nr:MAG: hypothetical protein JSV03_07015 [Planctomycetota bacterium]